MLAQYFDDAAAIKASAMPSGLVEVPRVNEKYEVASFFSSPFPPQFVGNLRTLEIVANCKNDPVMNVNAAFFRQAEAL